MKFDADREASGLAAPGIRELEDGWLQVKIPLPYSLKWVNAYLLPEDGGWTLIDPGLRTPEAIKVWLETLGAKGIGWSRISRIVLTHHHPDHYGLAGWFQEYTGAPVWISEAAEQAAERLWGDGETYSGQLTEAFLQHGLPDELANDMRAHLHGFRERVSPRPITFHRLSAGTSFRMGGREWESIGGEGHAPGHLSFYDRQRRNLICGDQVLPDISPNIGWMPDADPDPLGSYLHSLRTMQALEVDRAFPGHRDPFGNFHVRVQELLAHHERRLDKMMAWIGSNPVTSFDVCEGLFGTRLREQTHQLRFALAETIAHLVLLERREMLQRSGDGDSQIRYSRE